MKDRRAELLVPLMFCVVFTLGPFLVGEVYPLTYAPMFADAPKQYCDYTVYAPDGTILSAEDFGVHRAYWGNPLGIGCGYKPTPTCDCFGEVAQRSDVEATIRQCLAKRSDLVFVEVEQVVIGALPNGGVGEIGRERWRVYRP